MAATPRARYQHSSSNGAETPQSASGYSPGSFASPTSEGLLSPRGSRLYSNQKAGTAKKVCFWILLVLMLGILNVMYRWETHDKDLMYLGNTLSTTKTTTTIREFEAGNYVPTFPFQQPDPKSAAVFYHVYFPPTPEGQDNSARIIQEQLQQLQGSNQKLTIYYNTIGDATPRLNTTHIQKFCKEHLHTCHHMHHFDSGMEDKTLQRLHDFCSLSNEDYPVLYLHNKGSYSTKPLNEAWRYQMTQSIASESCETSVADKTCNLCGLWFSAERGMFMAGNMWRSPCSYIQKLIPPRDFQEAMHKVTAEALMERLRWKLLMTMQELRAGVFGVDRYATEFWVASHPSVKPCDFSRAVAPLPPSKNDITDHFLSWLRKMGNNYQLPLQRDWFEPEAPHHKLPLPQHLQVVKFHDVRLREYFLLAGSLFRWYFLYHEAPPSDSWAYRWFPDGDKWRAAVEKYGNESVSVVTSEALKVEVASGRNRYTQDHSKKLTSKGPAGGAQGPAVRGSNAGG